MVREYDGSYRNASNNLIEGTGGNDSIVVYAYNSYYHCNSEYVTIQAYKGDDCIQFASYNPDGPVTVSDNLVYAGSGNDTIYPGGNNSTVYGDAGNDFVYLSPSVGNLIVGGSGNDTIMAEWGGSSGTLTGGADNDYFMFTANTSQDSKINYVITDLSSGDVIRRIKDSYGHLGGDTDIICTIEGGNVVIMDDEPNTFKLTLQGVTDISQVADVEYQTAGGTITLGSLAPSTPSTPSTTQTTTTTTPATQQTTTTTTTTTTPSTPAFPTGSGYSKLAGSGSRSNYSSVASSSYTSIGSSYSSVSPYISGNSASGYSYNYTGGNKYIDDFQSGDMINIPADFTGVDYDDTNFMVKSTSGTLRIENMRDKVMDFGLSGTSFIKICLMKDMSGYDGTGVSVGQIVFGSDSSDTIKAGSGGSMLWGGLGGNDTLVGGDGVDTFIYTAANGNDVIQSASDNDVVDMSTVSVFDLTSIQTSGKTINLTTNTGGTISVQCNSVYSPKFQLAEGNVRYSFSQYSQNGWQMA